MSLLKPLPFAALLALAACAHGAPAESSFELKRVLPIKGATSLFSCRLQFGETWAKLESRCGPADFVIQSAFGPNECLVFRSDADRKEQAEPVGYLAACLEPRWEWERRRVGLPTAAEPPVDLSPYLQELVVGRIIPLGVAAFSARVPMPAVVTTGR